MDPLKEQKESLAVLEEAINLGLQKGAYNNLGQLVPVIGAIQNLSSLLNNGVASVLTGLLDQQQVISENADLGLPEPKLAKTRKTE